MPSSTSATSSAVALVALFAASLPLQAQNFGDRLLRSVERTAEREVQRSVDQRVREVTRCAMGDERCIRQARDAGHEVEIVRDARPGDPASAGVPAAAAEIGADYEHPLISAYPGSTLRWRDRRNVNQVAYDEYRRIVGYDADAREPITQTVSGRVTRLVYDNPPGRSITEILANYRQALEARGANVDWSCDSGRTCGFGWPAVNGFDISVLSDRRYFTGVLEQGGREVYFAIGAYRQRHVIHLVEVEAMESGMVTVSADALGEGLDRDGRIELQGIYFDTGRATLTAESQPALEQVGQLLRYRGELSLRIVGHTDSSGDFQANVQLSQDRADAVRLALMAQFGVAAERLTAQGVGPSVPVASNDTEDGRARNRRVELVLP